MNKDFRSMRAKFAKTKYTGLLSVKSTFVAESSDCWCTYAVFHNGGFKLLFSPPFTSTLSLSLPSPPTMSLQFNQPNQTGVLEKRYKLPSGCGRSTDAKLILMHFVVKLIGNVLWTRKGVRATVVTAGHCMHTELTRRHALASCYSSCCVR